MCRILPRLLFLRPFWAHALRMGVFLPSPPPPPPSFGPMRDGMLIPLTGRYRYARCRGDRAVGGWPPGGRCDYAGGDPGLSGRPLSPWAEPGHGADVPRQAAGILRISAAGQAGGAGHAGRLAVCPAGGRLLPQHGKHPSVRRQRAAGVHGAAETCSWWGSWMPPPRSSRN